MRCKGQLIKGECDQGFPRMFSESRGFLLPTLGLSSSRHALSLVFFKWEPIIEEVKLTNSNPSWDSNPNHSVTKPVFIVRCHATC